MNRLGSLPVPNAGEDIAALPSPSEEMVLTILKDRYSKDEIFTRIGQSAMISVNPMKHHEKYSETIGKLYADYNRDVSPTKNRLDPHIFDLAGSAYMHMWRDQQDQCILIVYAIYIFFSYK